MKTDNKFTQKLQEFMNKPDSEKDWAEGAILLLQLTGNQIMYRNISVNPKGKAEFIKGTLQKHLNFRLAQLTHDEVNQMQAQVDEIVTKVIKPADHSEFAEFKAGKRPDHDSLPDSIQALYTENLNIVHKMRELHLRLRTLSTESTTCPDSDRYPFLKELITLDKQLRSNWETYDHYVLESSPIIATEQAPEPEQAEEPAPEPAQGEKPKKSTRKSTKNSKKK
jgi:hypothetical protein